MLLFLFCYCLFLGGGGGFERWGDKIRMISALLVILTWHLFEKGMNKKLVCLEAVEVRKIYRENAPNHIGMNLPRNPPQDLGASTIQKTGGQEISNTAEDIYHIELCIII